MITSSIMIIIQMMTIRYISDSLSAINSQNIPLTQCSWQIFGLKALRHAPCRELGTRLQISCTPVVHQDELSEE